MLSSLIQRDTTFVSVSHGYALFLHHLLEITKEKKNRSACVFY
jgi:hypothetical protein